MEEILVINTLRNDVDKSLGRITQDIVNLEYKMDQSDSNFYNLGLSSKLDQSLSPDAPKFN